VTLSDPSPNFGDRRGGLRPELVVLHFTAMASCAEALARLCDPAAEVSAHYLIDTDGTVLSLVAEDARAWHAGAGRWGGREDVNSRSIGIELSNRGTEPFAARQMLALEGLLADVLARWSLPPQAVIGHSDMAPDRKADPGPRFDWRRLALSGLSVWPGEEAVGRAAAAPSALSVKDGDTSDFPAAQDAEAFCRDLRTFGYPDVPPETLLTAFRLRFRPWATGPLGETDRALAADLARRFPVDAGAARA
jgi:N-acetylmuramoyl-L-alanine amidase